MGSTISFSNLKHPNVNANERWNCDKMEIFAKTLTSCTTGRKQLLPTRQRTANIGAQLSRVGIFTTSTRMRTHWTLFYVSALSRSRKSSIANNAGQWFGRGHQVVSTRKLKGIFEAFTRKTSSLCNDFVVYDYETRFALTRLAHPHPDSQLVSSPNLWTRVLD